MPHDQEVIPALKESTALGSPEAAVCALPAAAPEARSGDPGPNIGHGRHRAGARSGRLVCWVRAGVRGRSGRATVERPDKGQRHHPRRRSCDHHQHERHRRLEPIQDAERRNRDRQWQQTSPTPCALIKRERQGLAKQEDERQQKNEASGAKIHEAVNLRARSRRARARRPTDTQ